MLRNDNTTLLVSNTARKKYLCGGTDDGDKLESFLFTLGLTVLKLIREKPFAPSSFNKTIGVIFLFLTGFHMIRFTVAHDIVKGCRAKNATTLPLFNTACRAFHRSVTIEIYDIMQ